MPRKGPAHPISPAWRERVLAEMDRQHISQNELARRAHISKAALSKALSAKSTQTTVMAEIHKALGWPPPPLDLTPDKLEMLALYEGLSERDQGAVLERLRIEVPARRKRN